MARSDEKRKPKDDRGKGRKKQDRPKGDGKDGRKPKDPRLERRSQP